MPSRFQLPAIAVLNAVLLGASLALMSPAMQATPKKPLGPAKLHLQWQHDLAPLSPTWPDQPRFTTDATRRPVPTGEFVLLSCSRTDSLLALDAESGEVRWRFTANGPVRFAPAIWRSHVYVTSDDGYLYCLDLADGKVNWSFRGGPSDRRILGNERLISTWPARGAPVVADDGDKAVVYFAAGIWPFMGIFLHALDADTGEVRWSNSGDGSMFIKQPHNTDAFAGVAPQGSLVIDGDQLFVPNGRSVVACYDRHTGKLLHYRLADNSKRGGGPDVRAVGEVFLNGPAVFKQETGDYLGPITEPAELSGTSLFSVSGTTCRVFDASMRQPSKDKKVLTSEKWAGEALTQTTVPRSTVLLAAEDRLYGAGPGKVYALTLPLKGSDRLIAEVPITGTPIHLAAGEERLFVSTQEGRIYAFGAKEVSDPLKHARTPSGSLPQANKEVAKTAQQLLKTSRSGDAVREGYAVIDGAMSPLIPELLRTTKLNLIVTEPNAEQAESLRQQLIAADIDFKRCTVVPKSLPEADLPPYLCELIVCESAPESDEYLASVIRTLRPYGGVACLRGLSKEHNDLLAALQKAQSQAKVTTQGEWCVLRREGGLPGAGEWTHQHADAANTRVSPDKLVKAPMGLLWFGGPGNQSILPRHGHGPVPQSIDGRLIIEGMDLLRATDVYTGRLLWETKLPGLGSVYNNLAHQPGANASGSNYVSLRDGIYVAHQRRCLRLNPATGKEMNRYTLPKFKGEKLDPEWMFIAVDGSYLIGGATPEADKLKTVDKKSKTPRAFENSRRLTVIDRRTGKVLWSADAKQGWRHNAVVIGNGRLYAIDRTPVSIIAKIKGAPEVEVSGRLVCFELTTGKQLWTNDDGVFGTMLSYSSARDVLVESGLVSRDTLNDEATGMRAYGGERGNELWYKKEYIGPAMIHHDKILKGESKGGGGSACELLTGKPIQREDPLTGEAREWKWTRTYGCNTPAGCENMLLFRSGAAGFYDLANDGGTGNFGGFRSSCTMNLIAAGGVLTIPDYTRTCTCSYQNQASVGLIHTPDADVWTFTQSSTASGGVRQLGVNLGGAGSRKAENKTLWIEYPAVGGPSPKVSISTMPAHPETFRLHTGLVKGEGAAWVASSGLRGVRELTVRLGPLGPPRKYTVRLTFLEPDRVKDGDRVFDVQLQGQTHIKGLDVSKEAGGQLRGLLREVKGVVVRGELRLGLLPAGGSLPPVLSGVEVVSEE